MSPETPHHHSRTPGACVVLFRVALFVSLRRRKRQIIDQLGLTLQLRRHEASGRAAAAAPRARGIWGKRPISPSVAQQRRGGRATDEA